MALSEQSLREMGVLNNIRDILPPTWSLDETLIILRYLYPSVVYLYFVFSSVISVLFLHTVKAKLTAKSASFRSTSLVRALRICNISFLVQLGLIFASSLLARQWLGREDEVVGLAGSLLLFSMQSFRLSTTDHPVWYPFLGSWAIGLITEPCILTIQFLSAGFPDLTSTYDILSLSMVGYRFIFFLVTIISFIIHSARCYTPISDEESRPLLGDRNQVGNDAESPSLPSSYGSTTQASSAAHSVVESQKGNNNESDNDDKSDDEDPDAKNNLKFQERLMEEGNWFVYLKKYKVLFPYIWPVGQYGLQLRLVFVMILMMTTNVCNVLLPRQIGIIMDSLTGTGSSNIWIQLLIFCALQILTSECGFSFLTDWLYFPVANYSRERLNSAAFEHVMELSADFHDSKTTPETIQAIKGGEDCSTIIEIVLFDGFSRFVDLVVAIVYLTVTFGPYEGLISVTAGTLYLHLSANLVSNISSIRREYISASYEESRTLYNAVDGWQTVVSFNQAPYENQRYSDAMRNCIKRQKLFQFSWYGTRALQSISLMSGLFCGCILAIIRVKNGQATAGQLTMLLMYWAQLTGPLMYVTMLSKRISSLMIEAERVLNLLNQKTTTIDKPGAQPLRLTRGDVTFNGVSFAYRNSKTVLNQLSFHVHGGQSVAFVGATGAGKSTILKLLCRFYDSNEGTITIDHQDITSVQIISLRHHIGLVPQSPVLFNDTIMNNIRYARLDATDEDVFKACKAAHIHDKIMGFTKKYDTKVGERGVKLSGGELQRVAIARAILKRPNIVLLDEATSAVDTDTEQKIQESFRSLTENRTTFIVAHRLSTIMNADLIIVVDDGKIKELGTHESLLAIPGMYRNLWAKQIFVRNKNPGHSGGEGSQKLLEVTNDLSQEVLNTFRAKVPASSTVSVAGSHTEAEHGNNSSSRSNEESQDTRTQRPSST